MNAAKRSEQDQAAKGGRRGKGPKCPICGKPASPSYRPFCGSACADIDLGRWLDGRYVVPGEPVADKGDDEAED